jgi:hypothetical protein
MGSLEMDLTPWAREEPLLIERFWAYILISMVLDCVQDGLCFFESLYKPYVACSLIIFGE